MKLELKNIKEAKFLSQETPAYTATLYVDGKKAAIVENQGHGGCDDVHWLIPDLEAKVDAYFKTLPKKVYPVNDTETFEMEQDLEVWCQTQVQVQDIVKSLKRKAKRQIVGVFGDGREVAWKATPDKLPQHRAKLVADKPGIIFVNELTDAEIVAYVTKLVENV